MRGEPEGGSGRDRIGEEFRLLLDAAAWRAEEYLRGAGSAGAASGDREPGADNARSEERDCGWCPICAVAALLRGDRPELTARLADQLAGLVELLRDAVAAHEQDGHAAPEQPGEGAAEPPKVQRIDVRRVRGPARAQES